MGCENISQGKAHLIEVSENIWSKIDINFNLKNRPMNQLYLAGFSLKLSNILALVKSTFSFTKIMDYRDERLIEPANNLKCITYNICLIFSFNSIWQIINKLILKYNVQKNANVMGALQNWLRYPCVVAHG